MKINYALTLFVLSILISSAVQAQFGACCGGHGGVCGCKNGGVVCCDGFTGSSCSCEENEALMVVPTATAAAATKTIVTVQKPDPTPILKPATPAKPSVVLGQQRYMPNSEHTPGDLRSVNKTEICQPNYIVSLGRASEEAKNQAYSNYGIDNRTGYEIDHLISKGIGGSSDPKNLWPQIRRGAWSMQQKDQLENHLRKLMCAGKVDLELIQQEMRTDWIKAYKKYLGEPAKIKDNAKHRAQPKSKAK